MGLERDASVVSALRVVVVFVEYGSNDRVLPLLWDCSLAPDEGDDSAGLQEHGQV